MLVTLGPISSILTPLQQWTTVGIISSKLEQIGQLERFVAQMDTHEAHQASLSSDSSRQLEAFHYRCFQCCMQLEDSQERFQADWFLGWKKSDPVHEMLIGTSTRLSKLDTDVRRVRAEMLVWIAKHPADG